jgi:hypothetical protein
LLPYPHQISLLTPVYKQKYCIHDEDKKIHDGVLLFKQFVLNFETITLFWGGIKTRFKSTDAIDKRRVF